MQGAQQGKLLGSLPANFVVLVVLSCAEQTGHQVCGSTTTAKCLASISPLCTGALVKVVPVALDIYTWRRHAYPLSYVCQGCFVLYLLCRILFIRLLRILLIYLFIAYFIYLNISYFTHYFEHMYIRLLRAAVQALL